MHRSLAGEKVLIAAFDHLLSRARHKFCRSRPNMAIRGIIAARLERPSRSNFIVAASVPELVAAFLAVCLSELL
jgi:hypothetical protein